RIRVHAGQFIISRIDARNGASGVIPPDLEGAVVSSDFPTFTINALKLEPKFLDWLSKTRDFVGLCKAASEGTTNRVRLKEDRFPATDIPLPPLAEQRRLVARIDAVAAKVAEAKRLREEATIVAGSLWRLGARQCLDRYGKGGRRTLGELVTLRGGGTPSKT